MSIGVDQIRRLDAEFDRISLGFGRPRERHEDVSLEEVEEAGEPQEEVSETSLTSEASQTAVDALSTPRGEELLRIVHSLSTSSSAFSQLSSSRIRHLLHQSAVADRDFAQSAVVNEHEANIEWLLVSKAAAQTYGLILDSLFNQIIPLSDDIWYWEEVLNSYFYSSLYTVQTSPLRLMALYRDSRASLERAAASGSARGVASSTWAGLTQPWVSFYDIVHHSIQERSMATIQGKIMSPVALGRRQARVHLARLRKLREITSTGVGILVDEGLSFGMDEADAKSVDETIDHRAWRSVVSRSVALMDEVLKDVVNLHVPLPDFENSVFAAVEDDRELSTYAAEDNAADKATAIARRLLVILEHSLPLHTANMKAVVSEHGRPSRLIRYWLPATIAALSSTTVLQILVNRRAELITWAKDVGVTMRDFWANWIIEPMRKIVRTIRHDETSEIAIMSRDSLKADTESLERMVVDFAIDNPHFAEVAGGGSGLTESEIAMIRAKVREGDVTPVLRAYEKDLRSPFKGAVKGDLVRSLLIQIQKTKVDLEVAISGIDALLKSQELVFGFVGLTPGILVAIGVFQYLRGALGGRKGRRASLKAGKSVRVLRNIDRIFSEAKPTESNVLSYRDHGLLLCEVQVLRNLMHSILPRDVEKEFLEDLDDLANLKGFQIQVRALDRIKWAYARWLK